MKRLTGLWTLLFLLIACGGPRVARKPVAGKKPPPVTVVAYKGPKKKLAVTTFENTTRFGKRRLGANISDILITEMNKSGRFLLLERSRVDDIMSQVALSQAGITEGKLDQLRLLDADYIITGAVTQYAVTTEGSSGLFTQSKTQKARVTVDARLIDVHSGEVITAQSATGTASKTFSKVLGVGESGGYDESLEGNALRAAVRKIVEPLVQVMDERPWQCRVVRIKSDKIYLDAGKKSGLKKGTPLTLIQQGEAITDMNGALLGYEETETGTAVITGFIGENGAVAEYKGEHMLTLPLVARLKIIPETGGENDRK